MATKVYRLYCDFCGYNRWTDGTDIQDLKPYKRAAIPTGIPKYDLVAKRTNTKTPINLPKQFKCPKCGRLITPRKYSEGEVNEEDKNTGSETGSA